MADQKIKFSAEGIQGIHSDFEKIIQDANSLTIIFEKSGEQAINNLKQQISLLKERNEIAGNFDIGNTMGSNNFGNNGIQSASDFGRNNSTSVKEFTTSFDELFEYIKENGINLSQATIAALSRTISDDSNTDKNGKKKEDIDSSGLQKFIQQYAFANAIKSLNSKDPLKSAQDFTSNIGTSLMARGGKAGWVGMVLSAVAEIAGVQYNAVSELQPEATRSARLFNSKWEDFSTRSLQGEYFGLTRNESLNQQNELAKALGTTNLKGNLLDSYYAQAGMDLSVQDINSFARLGRGNSNFSIGEGVSTLRSSLHRGGLDRGQIDTQISDYLKILTELGQEQVELLGSVDVGVNSAMIGALTAATNVKNPATLRSIISGVQDGLRTATTPQVEALQFQTLAKISPNSSLWQLEKMREAPFSESSQDYFSEFINSIRSNSTNIEDAARNISNIFFGGQKKQISEDLATSAIGTPEFTKILKEAMKPDGWEQKDLMQNVEKKISDISRIMAQWEGLKLGSNISTIATQVDVITSVVNGLDLKGPYKPPSLRSYPQGSGTTISDISKN